MIAVKQATINEVMPPTSYIIAKIVYDYLDKFFYIPDWTNEILNKWDD